ncbi:MAG: ester cyclase [Flavobacteriales bacterium]
MKKATALLLGILLSFQVISCKKDSDNDDISNQKVETILNDFYRFFETADENLLEKTVSITLKDNDRNPMATGTDYEALLALAQSVQGLSEMHHNLVKVHKIEDNMWVIRWEATAKHTGPLFGIPATGKTVYFNGHDIVKIENEKITELWHIETLLQLMSQIQ